MDEKPVEQRLSRITTMWSVLETAHAGAPEAARTAQEVLLRRYGGAIHRYLLAALRDPHAADDLMQEFALKLVRGAFRNADPHRGRFRDYLRTALGHLINRYRRQQHVGKQRLSAKVPELEDVADTSKDPDAAFNESWRQELLARTWEALAEAQSNYYEIFRCHVANPKLSSSKMAEQFSLRQGRPMSAEGFRQTLRRARDRFTILLVEEVACSLKSPTVEAIEQELQELDLLTFCQRALDRYRREKGQGTKPEGNAANSVSVPSRPRSAGTPHLDQAHDFKKS
jgi:RNA polymerase sigma-70 factor (ECF subfamily)